MVINQKSQFGVALTEEPKWAALMLHEVMQNTKEYNEHVTYDSEQKEMLNKFLTRLLDNKGNRYYLLTKTVMEMASKVKIPEYISDFDVDLFKDIKRGKFTLLIDSSICFRFEVHDDGINVMKAIRTKIEKKDSGELYLEEEQPVLAHLAHKLKKAQAQDEWMQWHTFRIYFGKGIGYDGREVNLPIIKEFLRYLTFIELAEIDYKYVQPRKKYKTLDNEKLLNDAKFDLTIVDSTWNKYVIRTDGFPVNGFFRWQVCGEKFSQRKLKWIDGFEKHGYVRKPKKLLAESQ